MSDIDLNCEFGIKEWSKNHFYYGKILNNNYHNKGVYLNENCGVFYSGGFYVNQLNGCCKVVYRNGSSFVGIFNKHKRFGPGIEENLDNTENVGFWNGFTLMRLTNTINCIPYFFNNYKKNHYHWVDTSRKKENLAKEILENLGADEETIDKLWKNFYNIDVRNENSCFFNNEIYNRCFFETYREDTFMLRDHLNKIDAILKKLIKERNKLEKQATNKLLAEKERYKREKALRKKEAEKELSPKLPSWETKDQIILYKNVQERTNLGPAVDERKEELNVIYVQDKVVQSSSKFMLDQIEYDRLKSSGSQRFYTNENINRPKSSLELGEKISRIFSHVIPDTNPFYMGSIHSLYKQDTIPSSLIRLAATSNETDVISQEVEEEENEEMPFVLVKTKIHLKIEERIRFLEAIKAIILERLHKNPQPSLANNAQEATDDVAKIVHPDIEIENIMLGTRINKPKGEYEQNCENFLIFCFNGGSVRTVYGSIKNNINPDLSDARGNTGIMFASSQDHISIITTLIKCGAKIDIINDEGVTPLIFVTLRYIAILKGVKDWKRGFLDEEQQKLDDMGDKDVEKEEAKDETQKYVLMANPMCYIPNNLEGNEDIISTIKSTIYTLLNSGANPNIGSFPTTPLNLAIFTEDLQLITDILNNGANPNLLSENCLNGLHIVASLPSTKNNLKLFNLLLESGCDPNVKVPENHWPEYGKLINRKTKDQKNVLHMLCLRTDPDPDNIFPAMAKALRDYNFNFGEYYLGHTPLSLAITNKNLPMIEVLGKNVDLHQPLLNGLGNALTIFTQKGFCKNDFDKCKEIIDTLIKLGANPLHPFGEFDNVVDYMERGTAKGKKRKGKKGKSKAKKKKGSKTTDKSSKTSSKKSKKGKKQKDPVAMVKAYLQKLAKDTLLDHMKSKMVKILYLMEMAGVTDSLCDALKTYLTPDDVVNSLQVHFQSGQLKRKLLDPEKIFNVISFINPNEKRDIWTEKLKKTNFKRPRSRSRKFHPKFDVDEEKYKVCMYCLQKRKKLFLCPKCKSAWFCSEKCNKLSNKKNEHKCKLNFYKKSKATYDKILKQKAKEEKKQKRSQDKSSKGSRKKNKSSKNSKISKEGEKEVEGKRELLSEKDFDDLFGDYQKQLSTLMMAIEKGKNVGSLDEKSLVKAKNQTLETPKSKSTYSETSEPNTDRKKLQSRKTNKSEPSSTNDIDKQGDDVNTTPSISQEANNELIKDGKTKDKLQKDNPKIRKDDKPARNRQSEIDEIKGDLKDKNQSEPKTHHEKLKSRKSNKSEPSSTDDMDKQEYNVNTTPSINQETNSELIKNKGKQSRNKITSSTDYKESNKDSKTKEKIQKDTLKIRKEGEQTISSRQSEINEMKSDLRDKNQKSFNVKRKKANTPIGKYKKDKDHPLSTETKGDSVVVNNRQHLTVGDHFISSKIGKASHNTKTQMPQVNVKDPSYKKTKVLENLQSKPVTIPPNLTKVVSELLDGRCTPSMFKDHLLWLQKIYPDFHIPLLYLPQARLIDGQLYYRFKPPIQK